MSFLCFIVTLRWQEITAVARSDQRQNPSLKAALPLPRHEQHTFFIGPASGDSKHRPQHFLICIYTEHVQTSNTLLFFNWQFFCVCTVTIAPALPSADGFRRAGSDRCKNFRGLGSFRFGDPCVCCNQIPQEKIAKGNRANEIPPWQECLPLTRAWRLKFRFPTLHIKS